jgi:hypothetical protein
MQDWLLDLLQTNDLNQAISALSFTSVATAVALLIILVTLAAFLRDRFPASKPWLFWSMATIVLVVTFILIASTVYLNTVSTSGGPVHRHADFEMWACGEELELEDPSEFLSNKIGTPVLHEHNDKRIHLEGVVVEPRDGSLGKFMKVTGGSITRNSIVFPTNDGERSFINGETCQGRQSELQVFVYQTTENGYYTLRKLENPGEYTISDESVVPPGDCIIMEFAPPKQTTSKMCRQYEVALDIGDLKGKAPE